MIIDNLERIFIEKGDSEYAQKERSYMRNKFFFFGIKAPERRKITADFLNIAVNNLNRLEFERLIGSLWKKKEREFQYFGIDALNKRKIEDIDIELLEHVITTKAWWDSVDPLAKVTSRYFLVFPEKKNKIDEWISKNNIWLQRTSLIFQLGMGKETDEELLFSTIRKLKKSEEFFIKKAIGWALRDYSRHFPERVISFVENENLSSLSKREALKNI